MLVSEQQRTAYKASVTSLKPPLSAHFPQQFPVRPCLHWTFVVSSASPICSIEHLRGGPLDLAELLRDELLQYMHRVALPGPHNAPEILGSDGRNKKGERTIDKTGTKTIYPDGEVRRSKKGRALPKDLRSNSNVKDPTPLGRFTLKSYFPMSES